MRQRRKFHKLILAMPSKTIAQIGMENQGFVFESADGIMPVVIAFTATDLHLTDASVEGKAPVIVWLDRGIEFRQAY